MQADKIFVVDFGSQFSHLITRRVREMGVSAELVAPNTPLSVLLIAKGIILSGGPQNLSENTALRIDKKIFEGRVPILGICYGQQLMAFELGGKVTAGKYREYGSTEVTIKKRIKIFSGLSKKQNTWMSHGDQVTKLPPGFITTASSKNCPISAMANEKRRLYGVQFHPEVEHTKNGKKILLAFVKLTKVKKTWSIENFAQTEIKKIRARVGNGRAVCALSGGVDSAVAAVLVNQAIGNRLTCIFIDTGLMRLGEVEEIKKTFRSYQKIELKIIDAKKQFLEKLAGVVNPEQKRKIIGELFVRLFEKEAKKLGKVEWLVQGTLYTDAISSGVSAGKTAAVIKSHHNVGGLPKKFGFKLIEPLRELYKDEVRKMGKILRLPNAVVNRQPFPGPGMAVRIIGAVTSAKLDMLTKADAIVREEILKSKEKASQYFAVLPDIKSVGVQGDFRTYGHLIIIRAITTKDFMTADWAHLSYNLLAKISVRITNEVHGVNRVAYDITSKPPGTVEWE